MRANDPGLHWSGILDQDTLYTENHTHTNYDQNLYNSLGQKVEWSTPPDGLNWTLNHHLPSAFPSFFVEDSLSSEDSISRMIAWTIEHYSVPPAALVLGAQHWILVRGMTLSAAPQSSFDTAYTISQFRINDPWPPVPSWDMTTRTRNSLLAPPPPHSQTDQCGTGSNRGIADDRKIFPEVRHWSETLNNVQPVKPIFVQRMDHRDDYYYIVPLSQAERKATGALMFDARYGTFQQATSFPTAEATLINPLSTRKVHSLLSGLKLELGEYQGVLHIREEALEILENRFWKPCRESLSPLWPFWIGLCSGQMVYVRIDGKIFAELHDQICGL